mmetsp:Transcript_2293/g.8520  ORF Transcript_2293/g.8520 Transcript_2293/m.8520 type:complete len:105 (+) Transcript_2293:948-1262(+)
MGRSEIVGDTLLEPIIFVTVRSTPAGQRGWRDSAPPRDTINSFQLITPAQHVRVFQQERLVHPLSPDPFDPHPTASFEAHHSKLAQLPLNTLVCMPLVLQAKSE